VLDQFYHAPEVAPLLPAPDALHFRWLFRHIRPTLFPAVALDSLLVLGLRSRQQMPDAMPGCINMDNRAANLPGVGDNIAGSAVAGRRLPIPRCQQKITGVG
jgi:hypothetical protein